MATAFSTLLQIALPTQGELSGSWGDVVNNNITSMVEEAIAGLKTINTWSSNSATLSTANGTTAESRAAMLLLTDSTSDLTGAATLICPTLSKVYIVKNSTGEAVTIKTASGSGMAISNGNTSIVFCDGTNVVEAVTGITGNLDVGGNLTVGGTATVTGTTTFNGGTLTLGDSAADNVVFGADVNSSIIPNTDDTFDLGSASQEWRNLFLDGTANIDILLADTATIDSVNINGKIITMTGDTDDTAIFTAGSNGTLTIVTTDTAGAAANITITADGTAELAGTTVTLNSGGGITLDADGGTITFADAGSSLGTVTSSGFTGNVVGNVTGNTSGTAATVTGAAQSNITSVGTLTTLTIDDVLVDGKVITMTGDTDDTAVFTAGTNGTLTIATTDTAGAAGNIQITADGTAELAGTTVTLDSAGGITLDADGGTITFADAGSSLGTVTSNGFTGNVVGNVTGNLTGTIATATQNSITTATGLTSVGALVSGSIGAAFGAINNGSDTITTTGAVGTGALTAGGNIIIPNAGNIGSASDTDAIAIASNGVVTFSQIPVLPDNTVSTGDIQADAVTLAKMAGIARGKLIVGDASGNPAVIGPGTNTQILTSDGTDIAFADVPGASALAADNLTIGDAAILLTTSSGNITIDAAASDSDIILKGTDGGADTTFLTIDGSAAGEAIFNAGIVIADGGAIGSASDKDAIAIAANGVVTFTQAPVFPDGSIAGADINIDGTTDIGAALADTDEFLVDDAGGGTNRRCDMSRVKTYVADVTLTTAAQTNITSVGTLTALTVDDITINGSTISDGADLTIDVGGDIILDAAGDDILLKSGGTHEGNINFASSNLTIKSIVSDKDMIFQGNDGGSDVTALTLDMSAAGAAVFNNDVTAFSDKRLKTDISNIKNGLDKVMRMQGVYYKRNDVKDAREQIGVLAQDMEAIVPEVVLTADDDMQTKSVDYGKLTSVLIEAIKELKIEIDELKKV